MSYNPDIPRPTDQLSVSQEDLLQNFMSMYNAFLQNHGEFDSSIAGKHATTQFYSLVADVPTLQDEVALYARATGPGNEAELYYRGPDNETPINISRAETTGVAPNGSGSFNLTQGIKVQWRAGTVAANTASITINWEDLPNITQFGGTPIFTAAFMRPGATQDALFWVSTTTDTTVTVQARRSSNPSANVAANANFIVIGIGEV